MLLAMARGTVMGSRPAMVTQMPVPMGSPRVTGWPRAEGLAMATAA
jgi:hypothetical protein